MKNSHACARVLVVLTMAAVCAAAARAGARGGPSGPAAPAISTSSAPEAASTGAAAGAGADTSAARGSPPFAPRDASLQIDGPAGAHVTIDGTDIGTLPLGGPLVLRPGTHFIAGELRGYSPYEEEMSFSSAGETRRLQMRLIPLRRRDAVLYSFVLAGLGENYVGRPLPGYLLTAAEIGGLLGGLAGQLAYDNHRSDYLVLYDAYRHAVSEEDVAATRAQAEKAWNDLRSAESLRNTGLLVAAGAVVVGALDVWLRFPSVDIGPGRPMAPVEAQHAAPLDPTAVHVACNLRF